jgi:hypothetical protein
MADYALDWNEVRCHEAWPEREKEVIARRETED